MPKRPKFDDEEAEGYLNFLASLEGDLSTVSASGRSTDQRALLAGELLNAAEDAPNPIESIPLLLRAVRINPACTDARLTLMHIAGGPDTELIDELRELLPLAERDLGPGYIDDNRGHFWGLIETRPYMRVLIETRPYMRVRAELAQTLFRDRQTDAAMAEFEELLSLSPNDNLGMRYPLIGLYLEAGKLLAAGKLFKKYPEDSAVWLWARVLERILAGDAAGALLHLSAARAQNPHVEGFLTGKRKTPKEPPPYYEPGKVSEAILCMGMIGPAWKSSGEAISWLISNSPSAPKKASKKSRPATGSRADV